MPNSDKNILITPSIGSTNTDPKIDFVGASTNTGPSTITAVVYPTNSGTLSFQGSEGTLFSITNSLSSGSIFSVNPISGIPIIDVNADRTIALNPFGGNTGIGTTNPTSKLTVQGDVRVSGVVTATTFIGNLTGNLSTARTFQITGDVVSSAVSFDGSGNVSLASTIQPNSVALGTDTTGDYVQTVSGTSNQITVTGGTGESSTPTLSIPNQFTIPQDATVTRDLQVTRNLNVNGNITIGGSSASLFTSELKIFDPDIVLGFRTDGSGNDISTDNTANHGGIAVASTEGTPLVSLYNVSIGETNPATYKKIMWFKSGSFSGLGTDAWLFNYGVGIGSTQVPNGVRLAAGNVQFTQNDLSAVRNINASGIITSSTLVSTVSTGTSPFTVSSTTLVTNLNADLLDGKNTGTSGNTIPLLDGTNTWSGNQTFSTQIISTQANSTTTGGGQIYLNGATGNRIDFNTNGVAAPAFTTRSAGTKLVLYPNISGSSVDFAFGIEGATLWSSVENTSAQFKWYAGTTNIATLFGAGELVLGTTARTGTASQTLQVTGGAYVSGNLGIGQVSPSYKLEVVSSSNDVLSIKGGTNATFMLFDNNTLDDYKIGGVNAVAPFVVYNNTDSRYEMVFDGTGNVLIGSNSATGTASQLLQVNSGAYVSGNLGVGTVSPSNKLVVSKSGAEGFEVDPGSITNSNILLNYNRSTSTYVTAEHRAAAHVFAIAASEKARIDSSGRLLVGTSSARSNFYNTTLSAQLQVEGNSNDARTVAVISSQTGTDVGGLIVLGHQRSGSVGGNTILQSGDDFGAISFQGSDGTEFVEGARIQAMVDGTPGANDMPGRLVFSTTADGSASPTERMRLDSSGRVGIGTTTVTGYSSNIVHLHGSTGAELHITTGGTGTAQSDGLTLYVRDSDGTAGLMMRENNALTFGTNDNERARIDSSGRLLVGTSSARANFYNSTLSTAFQVEGTTHDTSGISIVRNQSGNASHLALAATRGTTVGSNTIVQSGDTVGAITFQGSDGTEFIPLAEINGTVDGTPGANDMPGRLVFSTTADGAAGLTERMRIANSGNVGIGTTNPTSKLTVQGDVSIASTVGIGTVIDIIPYDTLNSGTLSWEGSAGQLFSITNNLTSGSIFSVNDVTGIPSIDVNADGTIQLGAYGGNIGVGTTNPTQKLDVTGNIRLRGALYDSNNVVGSGTSVLISTGVGVSWISISRAALQGVQGTLGAQGVQGTLGAQGSQGTLGAQGSQGTLGAQGVQGTLGAQGSQGTLGAQGVQGTLGAQGSQGTLGAQGVQGTLGQTGNNGGVPYTFSTTTADADPGNGVIRYNNSVIGSVTFIYIDNNDSNSNAQTSWYDTWDDSTDPNQKGYLIIRGASSSSTVTNIWNITGAVTVASGYYKIPVSNVSGTIPADTTALSVLFSRTGNQGAQGAQGLQGSLGAQGSQGLQGVQGSRGITAWTLKTSNYTAVNGDRIIADTSGGVFTVTLPSSPSTGDAITIADGANWKINNLGIGTGGNKIEGSGNDFALDISGITVDLIYRDAATGWQVYANVGPQGLQGVQGTSIQGVQGPAGSGGGGGGGGSGTFDVGISTSIYVSVTSGIATGIGTAGISTAASQLQRNNDIFIGPGIGYSFPSTAGREYVIESIHVTNTFSNELYLAARQDYFVSSNNWRAVPISQRVIVPYQGSTELLEQPIIANPQDILRFQALAGAGTTAAGVDGGLDAFITYSTKTDTNYVGVGSTVVSPTGTEIYTSTTYPTVIQSIRIINYNLNIDIDASVSIYRGGTVGGIVTTGVRQGYLVYNMTVPKNSTIEICQKPKYLATNDSIVAVGSTINSLAVCVSGKQIV